MNEQKRKVNELKAKSESLEKRITGWVGGPDVWFASYPEGVNGCIYSINVIENTIKLNRKADS